MLAVLTTHPIQYQVPLWKALSARGKVPFRVFYMSDLGSSTALIQASAASSPGTSICWLVTTMNSLMSGQALLKIHSCGSD